MIPRDRLWFVYGVERIAAVVLLVPVGPVVRVMLAKADGGNVCATYDRGAFRRRRQVCDVDAAADALLRSAGVAHPIDMTGDGAREFYAATCTECGGRFRVDGGPGAMPRHQRTVLAPAPALVYEHDVSPSAPAGYAARAGCAGSRGR